MKQHFNKIPISSTKYAFYTLVMMGIALLSACGKRDDGYYLASKNITSIIQINVDSTAYSITSAPDVVNFTTAAIDVNTPNFRQYTVSGTSTNGSKVFTLIFHTEAAGSANYVLDGSQLTIGSKTYISVATNKTDRVSAININDANKLYKGDFSFYSFNKLVPTDSVLVTGTYSIQK